jgi:peptidoglycan hydrolase-like protein with peptidoglycan-binding domain
VQELKTLLRNAGFYDGAINDEMGPMGVDALKRAKSALNLGGPADVAGPTTIDALRRAGTSQDFGAQLRSGELSKTPIYLAIGLAEGTIGADGRPTSAYFGHQDPGNGVLNRGFGSYQVFQHPRGAGLTAPEADRVQADRLAAQWPVVDQALTRAGIQPGPTRNLIAANALDGWNQAPATFNGTNGLLNPNRLAELKRSIDSGRAPIDAIVDWRANSYREDNGTLNAPGLGNSMSRVQADQRRRAEAVAQGLSIRAGTSTGSPTTPSAPTPRTPTPTTPTTPTQTLRSGTTGDEVKRLQQSLNQAGAAPRLEEDGDFGARTEAALRAFQQKFGLEVDGVAGPDTFGLLESALRPTAPSSAAPTFEVKPGSTGPQVRELKEALKAAGFYDGVINDQMGPDGVASLRKAKEALKLTGPAELAGPTTLEALKKAASSGTAGGAANVNHPWLKTLSTAALNSGPDGSCVATTLGNLDRLGIPSFQGGTTGDPNNSRGAMVQMIQGGKWRSLALPGSQQRTISSPYGTVQAQVIDADAYERMARAGQIPSGAIIFQTRHGWDYGGGPFGNDMGIVRDGGRVTHNYRSMSPIIYGDAKEVVLLVPR